MKIDRPRLSPRKAEKSPQSLGPRWRASRMASADVAMTAANCERERAELSAADDWSHVGDLPPPRGCRRDERRFRHQKMGGCCLRGGPQDSQAINSPAARDRSDK